MLELFKSPAPFDPETSEMDRIIQFHRLVLLMNVDTNVDYSELQFIRQLAIKMGLNPRATNEVLERMKDYENNVVPPNELIAIFQKHHNMSILYKLFSFYTKTFFSDILSQKSDFSFQERHFSDFFFEKISFSS